MKGGNDAGNPFLSHNQHAKNPFIGTIQAKNNPFLSGKENINNPFLNVVQHKENENVEKMENKKNTSDCDVVQGYKIPAYNPKDELIKKHTISATTFELYTNAIHNAYDLFINTKDKIRNERAKEVLENTTGSFENMKTILTKDKKPEIFFWERGAQVQNPELVVMNILDVKHFGSDFLSSSEKTTHALGVAMLAIHEGIHVADIMFNSPDNPRAQKTTGQVMIKDTQVSTDGKLRKEDYDAEEDGKQKWKRALTGHRGEDFEAYTMGKISRTTINEKDSRKNGRKEIHDYRANLGGSIPMWIDDFKQEYLKSDEYKKNKDKPGFKQPNFIGDDLPDEINPKTKKIKGIKQEYKSDEEQKRIFELVTKKKK